MIDAMDNGLNAAVMSTFAIGAYRHARLFDVGLDELYGAMDRAVASQFAPDHFAIEQMARLDVGSRRLQWINAGHPAPLLLSVG